MLGRGSVIGKKAPDFALPDQAGKTVSLYEELKKGPALIVFYPGDFSPVCTKQLCNYRDNLQDFARYGIQVLGISRNSVESHAEFAKKYDFTFKLLSDPSQRIAKEYGCTSILMFGGVSRAVVMVSKTGFLLYRYVEPSTLTRRKSEELIGIVDDLRKNNLL